MQNCSKCSAILSAESKFCASCGTSVIQNIDCPSCGRTINGNARFCNFCAFDLTQPVHNSATPLFFANQRPLSDKIHPGWIGAGITGLILIIFVITGFLYYSGVKEELVKSEGKNQELQKQIDGKNQELNSKNNTLSNLESQKSDLEGKTVNLTESLEKREKDVERKSGEIKKLQGSLKTVSTCLVGVIRGISALQQNNEYQARQSLFEIQSTCEKSGEIIKQVEKF